MLPPVSTHFDFNILRNSSSLSPSPCAHSPFYPLHNPSAPSPVDTDDDDQLSSPLSPAPSPPAFHYAPQSSLPQMKLARDNHYYSDGLDTPSPVDAPESFHYPTHPAPNPPLDRRMSAPALFAAARSSHTDFAHRYNNAHNTYSPPLHPQSSHHIRAVSSSYQLSSLGNNARSRIPEYADYNSNYSFPSSQSQQSPSYTASPPYQPSISSTGQYYGPASPASSSTSSSNPHHHHSGASDLSQDHTSPTIAIPTPSSPSQLSPDAAASGKTYSFIALPGNTVRKRPRRRYDEIERLYRCTWPECTKAYGTLNHLNAHVVMQGHGGRRSPSEFKELRRQWRKAKKETVEASKPPGPAANNSFGSKVVSGSPHSLDDTPQPKPSNGWMQTPTESHAVTPSSRIIYSSQAVTPTSEEPTSRSLYRTNGPYQQPYQQEYDRGDDSPNQPTSYSRQQRYWSPTSASGGVSLGSSSHINMNRLPPNSTLLTPLPGYQQPANYQSLLPPLMGESNEPEMPLGYRYDYSNDATQSSHRYNA